MTPVFQSVRGVGGDCWRASIATILDLPLEAVPHFYADYVANADDTCDEAERRTDEWLSDRGLRLEHLETPGDPLDTIVARRPSIRYALWSGLSLNCRTNDPQSPEAFLHTVVLDLERVRDGRDIIVAHDQLQFTAPMKPFATDERGHTLWCDLIAIVPTT